MKLTPSQLENRVLELGKIIASEDCSLLPHPDQADSLEWTGADVRITSDFEWEPKGFAEGHDLLVRTRHAREVTWLLLQIRDAFGSWLNAGNKYEFYGSLADAALRHLAQHQPEEQDPRPLLQAILSRTLEGVEILQTCQGLPQGPQMVIHTRDREGHQRRIVP